MLTVAPQQCFICRSALLEVYSHAIKDKLAKVFLLRILASIHKEREKHHNLGWRHLQKCPTFKSLLYTTLLLQKTLKNKNKNPKAKMAMSVHLLVFQWALTEAALTPSRGSGTTKPSPGTALSTCASSSCSSDLRVWAAVLQASLFCALTAKTCPEGTASLLLSFWLTEGFKEDSTFR